MKIFLQFIIALAIILLHINNSVGQITMEEILNSDWSINESELIRKKINTYKSNNSTIPLLDEVELRTETDRWDIKRQEYLMRFSFNGIKEKKAQIAINKNISARKELELDFLLQEELLLKYNIITQWSYLQNRVISSQKRQSILTDKLRIYEILSQNSTEIKVDDIISTEIELEEIKFEQEELTHKISYIKNILNQYLNINDSTYLVNNNWISIDSIFSIINQIEINENILPILNDRKIRQEEREAELDLEIAATKKIIDYFQIKYSGRDNLELGREFSIGMGIRLPMKGKNKIDIEELKMEIQEDKIQWEQILLQMQKLIDEEKNTFLLKYKKHQFLKKQLNSSKAKYNPQLITEIGQKSPLALLKLELSWQKRREQLIEIENEALQHYINILDVSGTLIQNPDNNFLAK